MSDNLDRCPECDALNDYHVPRCRLGYLVRKLRPVTLVCNCGLGRIEGRFGDDHAADCPMANKRT